MSDQTTAALRAALVFLLALAACSSGDDGVQRFDDEEVVEELTPCAEMLKPGRLTEDVVADLATCVEEDGAFAPVPMSWDCPDGSTIHQVSNYGWGRTGDFWQGPDVPEPYVDCVLPGTDAQHP